MLPGMNLVAVAALLLAAGRHALGLGAGSMLLMDQELPIKKCRYSKSYNMLQANCADLKLDDIPDNLQSGIEVLDARVNRVRELRNDTLSRYTSLRYLYLQDNFVQHVAEEAFAPTYYLEVLELSKNGLLQLPKNLFQLQSLRNLYLNENKLDDSVFNVSRVRSPLQWLHVSSNRLTQLPRLTPLATVNVLNVSHNRISQLSADDLAPLCSLQKLDISGNPIEFNQSSCDCHDLKRWIKFRRIEVIGALDCPAPMEERCGGRAKAEFSNRTMTLYSGCVTNLRNSAEARKARSTWIWIASCIGAFMSCIFVALCCMHKRNKGKRQRLKKQEILSASNANTEQLLNKEANLEQS